MEQKELLNRVSIADTNVIDAVTACNGVLQILESMGDDINDERLFALKAAMQRVVELLDEADEALDFGIPLS